ncbi:MAG: TIGR00266 family protein [Deltaproteobacteria bacterium]|jgi:uncharacterized protein (TIGR00266 family)|nr:TIGR00266 family protein [Deltaproteobacteria bacterium]
MDEKYEIIYGNSFPVVRYKLSQGEKLKAESGAMISMSATIDLTGGLEGGLIKSLKRLFAKEKFFFQYFKATRGPGEVIFAQSQPGGISVIKLNGDYEIMVQKDGYLASTEGIEVDATVQWHLWRGLFSGAGFVVLKVSGQGTVFLSSYGSIHQITLGQGEQVVVDNGHLVAWPSYMSYSIEKAARGWISSFKSGEFLVCRFTGPGTLLVQTRKKRGPI